MAIFNLDDMRERERELYSESTEMTLDEACEILSNFLNEARREDKEIDKLVEKRDKLNNIANVYRNIGADKAAKKYEEKADELNNARYVNNHIAQKNHEKTIKNKTADPFDYDRAKAGAKIQKIDKRHDFEGTANRPAVPVDHLLRYDKYHHSGISEKKPGTILDAQKKLNKLKEACITILEALEYEEEN